jgi:RNA polymerase sigma-70 factor (ECF subfamily)
MTASMATRRSLLLRIRDAANAEAWEQFVEIYTPLIYGLCRQHGLQDADAADVSQEVMRAVARTIGSFEYDPQRGKFRAWLLTVTRNKLWSFLAQQKRGPLGHEEAGAQQRLEAQPDSEVDSGWDIAYRRRVLEVAAQQVRSEVHDSTWQAFWRMVWDEQDAKAVARGLGMSVGAVYIAKSRVLARLRERIRTIDGEDHDPLDIAS